MKWIEHGAIPGFSGIAPEAIPTKITPMLVGRPGNVGFGRCG